VRKTARPSYEPTCPLKKWTFFLSSGPQPSSTPVHTILRVATSLFSTPFHVWSWPWGPLSYCCPHTGLAILSCVLQVWNVVLWFHHVQRNLSYNWSFHLPFLMLEMYYLSGANLGKQCLVCRVIPFIFHRRKMSSRQVMHPEGKWKK